ncbi:GNAT family N-acetyltransferase [Shimia sp.]|uniref:GNAT family N-acetyltransferase n=1 Tax=Shimia sp. TaxID=1954381 RepID=UPI003564BBA0
MSDSITVAPGDPRDPRATALLQQSQNLMRALFDPEENHFLEIDALSAPSIQFLVAREAERILGCAALADRGAYGEIKSMFVDPAARGKGVAHLLMQGLEQAARDRGLGVVKLETGDKLTEARGLYRAHGFAECAPFGDYTANATSVFMTKTLT